MLWCRFKRKVQEYTVHEGRIFHLKILIVSVVLNVTLLLDFGRPKRKNWKLSHPYTVFLFCDKTTEYKIYLREEAKLLLLLLSSLPFWAACVAMYVSCFKAVNNIRIIILVICR